MTSHGGPVVMGGAAGKSHQPEPDAAPQPRRYDAGPAWMRWVPPLAMLAVGLTRITTPSYWRDEAATLAAVRRPLGEMFAMMGHVDAVHGAYYLLAWVVYRVGGHTELFMRFPSVVAMCVAAGFVAALGRRLVSPAAGLLAGLAFVILPQVSFYAQDARSVAFETAMAAIASYLLIRALDAPERTAGGGRGPAWWWTCYALGIGLLGILNIFALLLVPAHLVTVAAVCGRAGRGRARWVTARRWLVSAAVGLVIASPLLYLGFKQKGQVSWLKVPHWLSGVNQLVGPMAMLYGALAAVAAGIVVAAIGGRARLRACWPAGLNQLVLPWLILPPALLLLGSLITPVYTFRYIMFCTPAVALILGAALAALARLRPAALGPVLAGVVLLAVAALGLNAQIAERKPAGHKDDLRRVDLLIGHLRLPGDVVYYTNTNSESFPWAYPYGLIKIPNVELARQPIASGTLAGTNAPRVVVRQRLAHVDRVWVVNMNTNHIAVPVLYGLHFHRVRTYRVSDIWLRLYIKRGSGAPIPQRPSSSS